MALSRKAPKQAGMLSLVDNDVQIFNLDGERSFFVEYVNRDGECNMTLVADITASNQKEAAAFRKEVLADGSVKTTQASDYAGCLKKCPDQILWTKHHPTPHEEAAPSPYPWGNPFTFPQ